MKKSKFAIANKLSPKQESILCNIQRATYEKDVDFLICLPAEVVNIAKKAQNNYNRYGVSPTAKKWDLQLVELVKKYWGKDGYAINQIKQS